MGGGLSVVVTSDAKPIARIVPLGEHDDRAAEGVRAALLARLRAEPVIDVWPRVVRPRRTRGTSRFVPPLLRPESDDRVDTQGPARRDRAREYRGSGDPNGDQQHHVGIEWLDAVQQALHGRRGEHRNS